jgi:hypothetical protein
MLGSANTVTGTTKYHINQFRSHSLRGCKEDCAGISTEGRNHIPLDKFFEQEYDILEIV